MVWQENPGTHPFQSPQRTLSIDTPGSHADESNHTESPTKRETLTSSPKGRAAPDKLLPDKLLPDQSLSGAVLLFGAQPEKRKRNSKIPFVMTNWKNTPLPPQQERLISVMLCPAHFYREHTEYCKYSRCCGRNRFKRDQDRLEKGSGKQSAD